MNLGMAFQLTNILRDLGNDAECGRVSAEITRFWLPGRRSSALPV